MASIGEKGGEQNGALRCLLTDGYYGFKMDLFAAGQGIEKPTPGKHANGQQSKQL